MPYGVSASPRKFIQGIGVFPFFAVLALPKEFCISVEVHGRFQVVELLLRHHVRATDRAKVRMLTVTVSRKQLSEIDHEVLEVHARGTEKGALLARPAVPERFIVNALGVEAQFFHNASGAALVDVLPVKIDHGAHGRALAALQAEIEMVRFHESLNLVPEVRSTFGLFFP